MDEVVSSDMVPAVEKWVLNASNKGEDGHCFVTIFSFIKNKKFMQIKKLLPRSSRHSAPMGKDLIQQLRLLSNLIAFKMR